MFKFLQLCDKALENAVLKQRVKELEDNILHVVTQQGDDICWMDVYTRLAALVGVPFDPLLLSDDEMLANCKTFVSALRSGRPYETPEVAGTYEIEKSLRLLCGHCDRGWAVPVDQSFEVMDNYFCPFCGHRQHFDKGAPT